MSGVERHSIDFVPLDERHGRVRDQGPFWFLSNFHFFAIAIGFVGPAMGMGMGPTIVAGSLGIAIGTLFLAFHASQGPEMGLPQMIQSRAQFGYRGVLVPLTGTLISLLGYNVVSSVLVAAGCEALWGFNRNTVAISLSLAAAMLAVWGYDWLHRAFKILFWISLPLFSFLTLGVLLGKAGGTVPPATDFTWAAFITQLASAASFNITAAPYVSDYSRYLPPRTPRRQIIFNVFAGAALSAVWLIAVGAWLATRLGLSDGLLALRTAGDRIWPGVGLGSLMAAVSIAALFATVGMNAYSAMLTFLTSVDSIRPIHPTRALRVSVVVVLAGVWTAVAVGFGGNAINYVNGMLVMMLYFLMPWTSINLIDYFFLRRGSYSIPDLFLPDGIYGSWNGRGLLAYAAGIAASAPFFVIPGVLTGPLANAMHGVDIGWLVGAIAAAATYLLASIGFNHKAATRPL
jgi:nucleobase:cation symporter-1, NCS1 family